MINDYRGFIIQLNKMFSVEVYSTDDKLRDCNENPPAQRESWNGKPEQLLPKEINADSPKIK
jgi:hypothetical protein